MNSKLKVLIMTIVSVVATFIANSGVPETLNEWSVVGITVLGVILTYLGKNKLFPSLSKFLSLDLRDLLSGLFLAIGAAVSDFAAGIVMGTGVDFNELWKIVLVVTMGYFSKTIFQSNKLPIKNK